MSYFIYVVRDVVTGQFGALKLFVNEASALRDFKTLLLNNPNFSDFELYKLGTYDIVTGSIVSHDATFICNGSSVGGCLK